MSDGQAEAARLWTAFWLDMPVAWAMEVLQFTAHRLQWDGAHLADLLRCATLEGALDCQASFLRTAVAEYGAEGSKLLQEARLAVPGSE